MIANVNGKEVKIYMEDGRIVRLIRCHSPAVSAYVSGDQVNIQLTNGHTEIYRTDGMFVRRI